MSHLTKNQLDNLHLPELTLVENRLRGIIQTEARQLGEITNYLLALKGKRLRPLLALSCSGIYRANLRARVEIATAAELIHTASLLHDDVVDEAELRRGHPSANKQWGNPNSILAGDFLFAKAFSILSNYTGALKIMTAAIGTMCEAELIQLQGQFNPEITPEIYVKIIAGKTASLLAASCECGGLVSSMPLEQVREMREYGMHLGIAYQIIDDIGDYILGKAQSGKDPGNDLKHGIITLPLLYVLANPESRDRVQNLNAQNLSLEPGTLALEFATTGALEKASQVASQHIDLARDKLLGLPLCRPTLILHRLAAHLHERCTSFSNYSLTAQGPGHSFQYPDPQTRGMQ